MSNVITDYYKFEKLPTQKSKLRIDCTASTKSYPEFEALRNKQDLLYVYWGNPPIQFGGHNKRKADKAITKVKNISSLYVPDVNRPFAYGDVKGTLDAILVVYSSGYSVIEIFIARGQKHNCIQLCNLLSDRELDNEIEKIREMAILEER